MDGGNTGRLGRADPGRAVTAMEPAVERQVHEIRAYRIPDVQDAPMEPAVKRRERRPLNRVPPPATLAAMESAINWRKRPGGPSAAGRRRPRRNGARR